MSLLRTPVTALLVCLLGYGLVLGPFTRSMKTKPVEEKLGYLPSIEVLRSMAADHRELLGAFLVMKVVVYFGGIVEKQQSKVIVEPPDYRKMSAILHGAVRLDPYNMDAYYFAQAFLTWDVKQYQLANALLDYGMQYRTWDWYLPFFAGFNSAYFLKEYAAAARYYQRAGELSGSDLSRLLAGRYLQESGQTELAIAYLTAMERGEKNRVLKQTFHTRLRAFREVRRTEVARDRYREATGRAPLSVEQLHREGYLDPLPRDPYGGRFYLEPSGKVTTTSRFAYAGVKRNSSQNSGETNERH